MMELIKGVWYPTDLDAGSDNYWCEFKFDDEKLYFYEDELDGEFSIRIKDIEKVRKEFVNLLDLYPASNCDEYLIDGEESESEFNYNLLLHHNCLTKEFIEEIAWFLGRQYIINQLQPNYTIDKIKDMGKSKLLELPISVLDIIEREVVSGLSNCG